MNHDELLKNTYGSIVDIKGKTQDIIKLMFQPVTLDSLTKGKIEVGDDRKITGVDFKVVSDEETEITFECDPNSVFCIAFPYKIFINDRKVKIITNKRYGMAHIDQVILCYQGMTGLTGNGSPATQPGAVQIIKDYYGLDVMDLTGTFSQYDGFEEMKLGYIEMQEKNGIPDHVVPNNPEKVE